ncbi:RrF2 family transcriptional regulator [Bifidobacterium tsurumiense]|uniref:RrF2 family transcriptional regulator n=1 Tax=Bifidobacterium tsurumiense TaxID=356829 RepID=UPI001930D615
MDTKFAQALHALVYISETTGTASSQALAQSVGTNPSHIRKLTGLLKQGGIVESSQGKAGFVLARPAEDITLADVYDAVYPDKHLFNVHEDHQSRLPYRTAHWCHPDPHLPPKLNTISRPNWVLVLSVSLSRTSIAAPLLLEQPQLNTTASNGTTSI